MLILYFSATGNNLYVSKQLGGHLYSIPKVIKEGHYTFSDEKIGIVFPIYELGVPQYIEDFLNKVELKTDYLFAVMTYGKFSGSASIQLQRIAKRNHLNFSYINEVLMVDNYLPIYAMEDQIKTESTKNIDVQIKKIKQDIDHKVTYHKKNNLLIKSLVYAAKKYCFPKRDKELGIYNTSFDHAFNIQSNCIGCGICSKVCPVNNIQINNKRPEFQGTCIGCLACTHNCPQNSIRVNGEQSNVRFRNQNISLKEIIKANN